VLRPNFKRLADSETLARIKTAQKLGGCDLYSPLPSFAAYGKIGTNSGIFDKVNPVAHNNADGNA
jgi:hypothetical protein